MEVMLEPIIPSNPLSAISVLNVFDNLCTICVQIPIQKNTRFHWICFLKFLLNLIFKNFLQFLQNKIHL